MSHQHLKQLIALDDWGTIAKVALPLIAEHGIPMLKRFYEKYVPKKI